METGEKTQAVLITGLSGAGKTHAADYFEDHGFYCIDNMPPALIRNFLELTMYGGGINKAAFVCDIRSSQFFRDLNRTLDFLEHQEGIDFRLLYMEASVENLIRRYSETRRNHPLARDGRTTREAIEYEKTLFKEVKARADYIIDTTNMKMSEFDREMDEFFLNIKDKAHMFSIYIQSFGFKNGIPQESDMVLDVRFLKNPFYVPELRKLTGKDPEVRRFVLENDAGQSFITDLKVMTESLIPRFQEEEKNHLNIAFGCTGGQHRSVVIAEEFARILREEGYSVTISHREI